MAVPTELFGFFQWLKSKGKTVEWFYQQTPVSQKLIQQSYEQQMTQQPTPTTPTTPTTPPPWQEQRDAIRDALEGAGGLQGMAGEGDIGGYSPFKEYGPIGEEFYRREEPYAGWLRKLRRGYGITGEGPVSQFAQSQYGQQRGRWLMDYMNAERMGQDATPWTDYTPQWGSVPGMFQRFAGQFTPESLGQVNYGTLTAAEDRGREPFRMAQAGTQMAGPVQNWFAGQRENLYNRWLSETPPGLEGARTPQMEFLPWLAQYAGR